MSDYQQRGFSLLELILVFALSATLILQLLHLWVRAQHELWLQSEYISAIQRLQFIANFLRQEINSAHRIIEWRSDYIVLEQPVHLNNKIRWAPVKYFIAHASYDNRLALYQQVGDNASIELEHDIVNFRVSVGPRGILLWILARSALPIYLKKFHYYFDGHNYISDDGYQYFSFPLYIVLKKEKK